jgi:NitT/TauT family transport system substrate-binding protein
VDTRTEAGTRALFGGENPAAVLYLTQSFIESNPNTVQALVDALYKALQWMKSASAEEIATVVPENYLLGDKALYVTALDHSKSSYSQTGMIDADGMRSTNEMLVRFEPELKEAKVDLSKTFDPGFVKRAAGMTN